MHAFGGGDAAKGLQVPLQHGLGENAVIPVLHRGDQAADLFQGLIPVNGGHRHQGRHIVAVLLSGHADIGGGELNAPPVFRHIRTNFYHLSGIRWRAHRAGVVPGLQVQAAGLIRNGGAEKGLAAVGGFDGSLFQNVKSLYPVSGHHIRKQLIIFHSNRLLYSLESL